MVSKSKTVQCEVIGTPDYVTADTVPVEISAFDHCVYFDYPDFNSVQRWLDHGETIEELKERGKLRDNGIPDWHGEVKTTQYLLRAKTLEDNPTLLEDNEHLQRDFLNRDSCEICVARDEFKLNLFLAIGEFFAKRGVVPSNRSGELFKLGNWGRTKGSYVATVKAEEANMCPECGESLSDTSTCVSSSNRTRVPNKYKCDPEKGGCGRNYEGITTG